MIAIFFIADRYLKYLALNNHFNPNIKLIGDIFTLSFTANYNIAFSLPVTGVWLNISIVAIVTLLLLYIVYLIIKEKGAYINIILLTIILIGAISNLVDRISLGYVVDYLYLKHFTIFNLADVMISLSAIIYILLNIRKKHV